jgi:hypothetical protein
MRWRHNSFRTPRHVVQKFSQQVESGNAAMQLSAPIDCPQFTPNAHARGGVPAYLVAVAASFASIRLRLRLRPRIHLVLAPLAICCVLP